MTCRYDREAADYLTPDGDPCRRDDYGDPTRHCTARRTCSNHIGARELTCARCVGRTRQDLRQIGVLSALMLPEAIARGTVETEPASLAGPAADPGILSWRRIDAARVSAGLIGDGIDDLDPTGLLGTWQMMLSEDYGHDLPDRITHGTAAAYLERNLHVVAQDEHQDFQLLARELRKCRRWLEAVLRDSRAPERGAPCPECVAAQKAARDALRAEGVPEDEWPKMKAPRLARNYGHWCDDPDCEEQFHFTDDSADVWRCPRNKAHWYTQQGYADLIEKRQTRTPQVAGC